MPKPQREFAPLVTLAILEQLVAISHEAGAAAMRYYTEQISVDLKLDGSPVTLADHAANEVIAAGLANIRSCIPVISEESTFPPFEERRSWRRYWLVDPLDGTKEFLHHNGEFTVNIALIEDGVPALGVVYAPAIQVTYLAAAGFGSWKRSGQGEATRLAGPSSPGPEGIVIVESRSHPSEELETFLASVKVARRVKAGSSLKFGLVAEGAAHLYPRFGRTFDWDVAAGDCVWRNATHGHPRPSPLQYNSETMTNPGFVIGITV
jgi:3'(2'), 5'-bisphosphate nucleotidase